MDLILIFYQSTLLNKHSDTARDFEYSLKRYIPVRRQTHGTGLEPANFDNNTNKLLFFCAFGGIEPPYFLDF